MLETVDRDVWLRLPVLETGSNISPDVFNGTGWGACGLAMSVRAMESET